MVAEEVMVEDEEMVLRDEVVSLFEKYYRNIRQMTPEQRDAFRPQLSALFMKANEKLHRYVNLIVVVQPHLTLVDANALVEKNPQMAEIIKKNVKSENFDELDKYLHDLNGQGSLIRIEREVNERVSDC